MVPSRSLVKTNLFVDILRPSAHVNQARGDDPQSDYAIRAWSYFSSIDGRWPDTRRSINMRVDSTGTGKHSASMTQALYSTTYFLPVNIWFGTSTLHMHHGC